MIFQARASLHGIAVILQEDENIVSDNSDDVIASEKLWIKFQNFVNYT